MARAQLVAVPLAAAALALLAAAASSSEAAASFTCAQVLSAMSPCFAYARGDGPIGQCCGGVRSLDSAARTPADRRFACGCLKSAAARVSGLNAATAAKIPSRCAVDIPTISPSIDCSRVS
ncbi:hypothetical protein GQ55_6G243800 [Panicum hallii var. hallii]|uniref:Non-specific lipid-transfer protein n=2 Tax=Panicum hallii TaxID=206008 RepID=A0A2T7D932_9POAL|nr:non-specific lipid-transfer protein-like [Panicum hallii]PAN36058.1 hypothetical protein PAHAL_6G255000 [Panicum hallii]PUZ52102.1 hypothetical protein GQ55_6G243800 [Panicum hallii var. hallii]